MNLERALPEVIPPAIADPDPGSPTVAATTRVYTAAELEELERQNYARALDHCEGRVSGAKGAAQLLGMKPSTLASRLKALGVKRNA